MMLTPPINLIRYSTSYNIKVRRGGMHSALIAAHGTSEIDICFAKAYLDRGLPVDRGNE